MNCSSNQNNNFLDAIEILSFILTLQNLYENREQSAHNDIQSANTNQTHLLLNQLNKNFEYQNEMLENISCRLSDIEYRMRKIENRYYNGGKHETNL